MGRLARRLDDEAAKIEVARQFAGRDPLFEQARDARLEVRENIHGSYCEESQLQTTLSASWPCLSLPSTRSYLKTASFPSQP